MRARHRERVRVRIILHGVTKRAQEKSARTPQFVGRGIGSPYNFPLLQSWNPPTFFMVSQRKREREQDEVTEEFPNHRTRERHSVENIEHAVMSVESVEHRILHGVTKRDRR